MAENTLFILVDQYGNSLENFKLLGRYTFYYNYSGKNPEQVSAGPINSGIVYGTLPGPEKGLESTLLVIELDSEFYNAPGKLLYKGLYQAPQKIAVSKKALDPKEKTDILKRSAQDLRQAALERIQQA